MLPPLEYETVPAEESADGPTAEFAEESLDETGAAAGGRVWLAVGSGALAGFLLVGLLAFVLFNPKVPGLAAGGAAGAAGSSPSVTDAAGAPLSEAPTASYLVPHFTLPSLAGAPTGPQDWRGRPVWLNFWASWCGPCRAEMPDMQRLYTKYKDQGLVILGVDLGESKETVASFVTQNKYEWTFLLDTDQSVGQQYYISGIPTHAFIDRNGVIQVYKVSGLPPSAMESYLAQILPK